MIEAWFDGAVAPYNPGGHGGYGMLVKRDGRTIHTEAIYVGRWSTISNNVTEYAGAIATLRYFLREGITQGTVHGDANLVINQLVGRWKIKNGAYVPYAKEALALRQQLPDVRFEWIPREKNTEADDLSQQAIWHEPRVIGFELDPSIDTSHIVTLGKYTLRNARARIRDQREQAVTDELFELFMQKTDGI